MQNEKQIRSLVYLLDDPDPFIQQNVTSKLMEYGEKAVPLLDEQKYKTNDDAERNRIDQIIHGITFDSLISDYSELLDSGIDSVEKLEFAVFTLARLENPTLRIHDYIKKLDRFADILKDRVHHTITDEDRMNAVLDFIFTDLSFKGDTNDYHNPNNAFMNRVVDRRKGLPISLALIVIFIGYRLNEPFYGINLPIHFMLAYEGNKERILIDAFDSGKVVTYNQCYYFLKRNGVQPKPQYFNKAKNIAILARCIRNLIHAYSKRNNILRIENLQKLLEITDRAMHSESESQSQSNTDSNSA